MIGDLRTRVEALRDEWAREGNKTWQASTHELGVMAGLREAAGELSRVLDADPDTPTNPALSLMGVPDDNNDDFSDLYVDDADDPDTLTTDDPECCASGRCEVCSPGFDWARNGALPDAPVDDGLVEQIAAEARDVATRLKEQAEKATSAAWFHGDAMVNPGGVYPMRTHKRDVLAAARLLDALTALVVARPWQAEVEAARQDALTKFHAEVRQLAENLATESNWGGLSQTDYDEFLAAIDFAYLAARGETRQP